MPKKLTKFLSNTKQKFGLSSSPSNSPKKSVPLASSSSTPATAGTSKLKTKSKTPLSGRLSVSPNSGVEIAEKLPLKQKKKGHIHQLVDDEEGVTSDSDEAGAGGRGDLKPSHLGGIRPKVDAKGNENDLKSSPPREKRLAPQPPTIKGEKDQEDDPPRGESSTAGGVAQSTSGGGLWGRFFENAPLTSGSAYNELYTEDKGLNNSQWWLSPNFLLNKVRPALFGTWDGVFATCVVHLFGVISFLRTGWLVGNDGILVSIAVVFGCLLFTTLSLLAAIGIIERCAAASDGAFGDRMSGGGRVNAECNGNRKRQDQTDFEAGGQEEVDEADEDYNRGEYCVTVGSARGNVHTLISTVLGSRIGSAISVIYMVGQAVSCSLHIIGFAESFLQLLTTVIQRAVTSFIARHQVRFLVPGEDLTAVLLADARWLYNITWVLSIRLLVAKDEQQALSATSITGTGTVETDHQVILIVPNPMLYFQVTTVVLAVVYLINRFGVRWVFRVQSVLFAMLAAAAVDFIVGLVLLDEQDVGFGPMKLTGGHLLENLYPNFTSVAVKTNSISAGGSSMLAIWHILTTVGVFFPSSIGVMAGVNMGADLKEPGRAIPVGSLSAIATSFILHLIFIIGLGSVASRATLLTDYSIGQHASALGFLFLGGLYMSAISSSLGSMYTGSRIMQALAGEMQTFPMMKQMAAGRGPNKVPNKTLMVFLFIVLLFNLSDEVNQLAPIVTILYLFTYATIEYAYFSMAMTFDIQISREKRFMAIATQLRGSGESGDEGGRSEQISRSTTIQLIRDEESGEEEDGTTFGIGMKRSQENSDLLSVTGGSGLDVMPSSPTPSIQHLVGYGTVQPMTQHIKIKRRQSTQSSSSSDDSNELGAFHRASSASPGGGVSSKAGTTGAATVSTTSGKKPKTIKQLMKAVSDDESDEEDEEVGGPREVVSSTGTSNIFRFDTASSNGSQLLGKKWPEDGASIGGQSTATVQSSRLIITAPPGSNDDGVHERLLNPDPEMAEIACKQEIWYLRLMNRWIILAAAILKVGLMFVIDWRWATGAVATFGLTFMAIGKTNPGFYPGVSEFVLVSWLNRLFGKTVGLKCFHLKANGQANSNGANLVASYSYDRIILPPTSMPNPMYATEELTGENSDYASRQPYHGSTTIKAKFGDNAELNR